MPLFISHAFRPPPKLLPLSLFKVARATGRNASHHSGTGGSAGLAKKMELPTAKPTTPRSWDVFQCGVRLVLYKTSSAFSFPCR
jgi:hypothetical protein